MPKKASEIWKQVDRYFADALIAPSDGFDDALDANRTANLPAIDVTPLQGKFLEILVRATGSKRILEIGTLGGYSTLWLARAIPNNGLVVTLELEPRHAEIAQKNLEVAGLADRVELRIGPAAQTLATLVREPAAPFDFIFIDADKASYPEYLQWSLKLSRPGTLIVADNVVRDGKVIDSENPDPNIQGVRRLTEMLSAEPRLSATALQTVAGKGYDGLIIAVVLH
ncbi:MAG: O-methyltransferase [Terracidiphilus sp.]